MSQENENIIQEEEQFKPILCVEHNEPIDSINVDDEQFTKLLCSKCQKQGRFVLSIDEAKISLSKLCEAHSKYGEFEKMAKSMLDTLKQFNNPCFQLVEKVNQLVVECSNQQNKLTQNASLKTMVDALNKRSYTQGTLQEIALFLSCQLKADEDVIRKLNENVKLIESQIQTLLKQVSVLAFKNKLGVDISFYSEVTQEQYLDVSLDFKFIAFSQLLTSDIIEIFSVEAKMLVWKYYPKQEVTYLKFSQNSKFLAAALKNTFDIYIYHVKKLESIQPLRILRGHRNIIYTMRFPSNSQTILTGGLDKQMILWNFKLNKVCYKIQFQTIILGIEISMDEKYFLVHSFKQIAIFSFTQIQEQPFIHFVDESTYLIRFGIDSKQLIIFSNVDRLELCNYEISENDNLIYILWNFTLKYPMARQMLRIIGTILISFGETIILWDLISGEFIVEFNMPKFPQQEYSYEMKCYQDLQLYAATTDMKQITRKMAVQDQKVTWNQDELEIVDLFENPNKMIE